MTIELSPELAAALTERAAHSDMTAEQYVTRLLYNLCAPFDLDDDHSRRLADLARPHIDGVPNWAVRSDEDDRR